MKYFILIFVALCTFVIISCECESGWEGVQELELRFTIDDIESFNISSGVIVFVDVMYEKILTGDYDRLSFYFDNKPVMEDIIIRWPFDKIPFGFITLEAREGYYNELLGRHEYSFRLTRQYASQELELEWDAFIQILSDAGKIVLPPPPSVITIDDIKSYNITTFEIEFTDSGIDRLYGPRVSFYFEDKPLLENILLVHFLTATATNNLVLVNARGNKFYLADGRPVVRENEWDDITWTFGIADIETTIEIAQRERGENAKKRETEWNLFISGLSDAGKLVTPPYVKLTFDDIKSYDVTTGEIVFTDLAGDKFKWISEGSVSFYFGNNLLFENIRIKGDRLNDSGVNDLVLVMPVYDGKFYLADGYPVIMDWDEVDWDEERKERWRKKREANAKKREVEWNLFMKYLSESGKIKK